jgi:hypothetical protein
MRAVAMACALGVTLTAAPIAAQDVRPTAPSPADSAIAEGRLSDAEQLLFAASSASTHDPAARGALGMFMAARGRLKVGAVLLEEARRFGADAAEIDPLLARVYTWLGDWPAVVALKHYAPAGALHERARWLATHPPARSGTDSATVALEPNEMAGLGRVALVIGDVTVLADIDPAADGLVLPSSADVAAESKQFGMHDSASVAVVYDIGIGAIHLKNVAARLSPTAHPTIGLDVLAPLVPAFDAAAQQLTLHLSAGEPQGAAMPFMLAFPGVSIAARAGQPLVRMESAAGRAALRGSRWTFDLRRGAIIVAP